jgi:O-antigen ligase
MLAVNSAFQNVKLNILNILLISLLPVSLISRSAIINIHTLLISLIFLFILIREKKLFFINNKIFYLLCFFWISLIINLFFSLDVKSSALRALGFGKFILMIFAIKYYLLFEKKKYQKFIYKIWFIIFLIISFDLFFEFIFGFNTLGYVSYMPGRLSGFLNDELKIGHYYSAFLLISLSYVYYNHRSNLLFYSLAFIFIFISFIIGERANFIKTFLIFLFFFFIYEKNFFFKKVFIFLTLSLLLLTFVKNNSHFKLRFWDQFLSQIVKNYNLTEFIKRSHYGAHYDTAIKIFYRYPIFGAGLKNFRNESSKDIYMSGDTSIDIKRWSTHPHQIHLEFLSETGIIGYISFLIFLLLSIYWSIRNYIESKNIYLLSSILFVTISIIPLLPSGSFFTTFGASIFWINYSIMITYDNKK